MSENIEELLNNKYGIIGEWDSQKEENYYLLFDSVSKIAKTDNPQEYLEDILKNQSDCNIVINVFVKYSNASSCGEEYVDLRNLLRIIQLISSPNAEPIKMYLAECGAQRINEISNPELIIEGIIDTYRKKGYSEEWITQKLRNIC